MNQSLYNEKKNDKTQPIKYEDVCNDDLIYLRLKSLKDGLDNNYKMNITQNDIKNMLTYPKISDFRLSSDVIAYDENSLDTTAARGRHRHLERRAANFGEENLKTVPTARGRRRSGRGALPTSAKRI